MKFAEVVVKPVELAVAGEIERRIPGGGEALAALGQAKLLGPEGRAPDVAGGLARRAGDRERGDEGALMLRGPAVGVRAARDRLEIEEVGGSRRRPRRRPFRRRGTCRR